LLNGVIEVDILRYDSCSEVKKIKLTSKSLFWADINWKKVLYNVRRLQARIAKATMKNNWSKVKQLQRLLMKSLAAKLLAVRKVTSNKGKNTPGIDTITRNTQGTLVSFSWFWYHDSS